MENSPESNRDNIPRNSLFLLLSSFVGMGLGILFWLLLSAIYDPELIGMASSTVTLANMISGIILLGIPTGSRRGLGIARVEGRMDQFKTIMIISFIILSLTVSLASVIMLIFLQQTAQTVGLAEQYILLAISIMGLMATSAVLKGGFIANLRAGTLFVAEALSSVVRIICAILLVSSGFGAYGAAMGYLAGHVLLLALLLSSSFFMLRKYSMNRNEMRLTTSDTLSASFPAWLPNIFTVLGSQLGVIIVQGISGATESGLYFISYSFFIAMMAIPFSITSIAFPLISGMSEGRIDAVVKTIRVGLATTLPFVVILSVYPAPVLGIFGVVFIAASEMLLLFMISIPFVIISNGILTYIYAKGNYRTALGLGLTSDLPKVLLYILLIPSWGGTGAAGAYLIGSLVSFVFAILISLRSSLNLCLRRMAVIVAIPATVGLISSLLFIPHLIGIPLIILVSVLGYTRLNLIQRVELGEMIFAIMPEEKADTAVRKLTPLLDLLYGK